MLDCPSVSEPAIAPVKLNDCVSPSGSVCFSIWIEPRLVLVKVQLQIWALLTLGMVAVSPVPLAVATGLVAEQDQVVS